VVTGLQGSRILLTETVPAFSCGTGVTEYETAFPGSSVEIHDGRATITLSENPVIVKEQ